MVEEKKRIIEKIKETDSFFEIEQQNADRPLSPHIQVYEWKWPMIYSILARATGAALIACVLMLILWIFSVSLGGGYYNFMSFLINSLFGKVIISLSIWAFLYHLFAGIRHIIWDKGIGFSLTVSRISGSLVMLFSILCTVGILLM